jgi:hypothetical protein
MCLRPKRRRHGLYRRAQADLPWQRHPVAPHVRVGRFRRVNPTGMRRTVSEHLSNVAAAYGHRFFRLGEVQGHLGSALYGEAEALLTQRPAIPISPDTMLRMVRTLPPAPAPDRAIGIDEWV